MPAVAVALRGGQGSESAVRLGNDNIGHARPPRTVWHSDARFHATPFRTFARRAATTSTYLEPGAPGVYHPFASRYFAKLPGVPARCDREKKNTSRGRASRCASREKWPSLLNARRAAAEWGPRGRCAAAFRRRRAVRHRDWPAAVDLTTARPTVALAAIVYTLPIGSLFLCGEAGGGVRERDGGRARRARCTSRCNENDGRERETAERCSLVALRRNDRSRARAQSVRKTRRCRQRRYRRRIR